MSGTVLIQDEMTPRNGAFPFLVDGTTVRNLWIYSQNSTGTTISGHKIVALSSSDTFVLADSATASHASLQLGMTTGAIADSAFGHAQGTGELTDVSFSFTPGDELYLGSNGAIVPYGSLSGARLFDRLIAVAITSTTIQFNIQPAIIRG